MSLLAELGVHLHFAQLDYPLLTPRPIFDIVIFAPCLVTERAISALAHVSAARGVFCDSVHFCLYDPVFSID